jgi:phosphoribosylanthranilate isomerase
MVSVKICGLTSESDLESAIRAGADRVGFVLVPNSPRHVDKTRAARMANKAYHMEYVPDRWVDVWVVANWSLSGGPHTDQLDELVKYLPDIAAVQLHGRETPEDIDAFKRIAPRVTVVKAIGVSTKDPGKPWVLSGGLTPENVAEAIRISGAKAVDVSSGVEASPGVKDAAKVKAFIEAAKAL